MPGISTRHVRRVWSVYRTYGVGGLYARLVDRLRSALGVSSKAYRSVIEAKARSDAAFDDSMGTDTGGIQPLTGLTIAGPNAAHGISHVAVIPSEFGISLAAAERAFVAPDRTTFVDLGSGKGRALLMAGDRGYRHMIGVEFAAELDAVARQNVQKRDDRSRFTLIHGDATAFDPPDGPVMLFLHHPFDRPVMATVAQRVMQSWIADPRPIRIVYQHPLFGDAWLAAGWREIATAPDCAIYSLEQASVQQPD